MNFDIFITPILSLGGLGFIFGGALAYASKKFEVKVDERVKQILKVLPAANCGACGYPGCANYAEAVVGGEQIDKCSVGGSRVKENIAAIMGVESSGDADKFVARVKCGGGTNCKDEFIYEGINSCIGLSNLQGGNKSCKFGCLGGGDCYRACKFDAIEFNEFGVARIIREKCVGCKACVLACPKNIIEMVPYKKYVHVDCMNKERGGHVMKNCSAACIACKRCEKECPFDAIHVVNNVSSIDYDKCVGCKKCVKVCPTNAISVVERVRKKPVEKSA